jgi:hypothetical protein
LNCVTKPTATPATEDEMGTPASIKAKLPPHTEAIDDEPANANTGHCPVTFIMAFY